MRRKRVAATQRSTAGHHCRPTRNRRTIFNEGTKFCMRVFVIMQHSNESRHRAIVKKLLHKDRMMSRHTNVYGRPLQPCSTAGMATTGYMRSGMCKRHHGDRGNHHICLDIARVDDNGKNFCQLTGQANWCAAPSRDCVDASGPCTRQNWCVCQWAFADVLDKVDCADLHVKCDATSSKALEAYRKSPKYEKALACLQKHCPSK